MQARALFGIEHPIILAPMAGGPSTPELAAAVSRAGGLGSLGVAYLAPAAIRAEIAKLRSLTDRPFAVNLFVPEPAAPDRARVAEVQKWLAPYRAELGIAEPPVPSSIPFAEQLAEVVAARVPIASFTFGVPSPETVRALKASGALVVGTATHVEEARQLAAAGVDAIAAQGAEAGGHRGTFAGRSEDTLVGTMALVPEIVDAVKLPVIAAGGIMDGRGIAAALALGAVAAQLGTAFLLCDEAGTDPGMRRAVAAAGDTSTTVTRAFTGRAGRGLRNRFTEEWVAREPAPFPLQHHLTADIRAAARKAGRPEFVNLWAGQGVARARAVPAGALVAALVAELATARRALAD